MINRFIKKKKIIALILLFLIIFSVVQPVLAVSGTGKFVGGQYASKYRTTDNNDADGILIRKLTNQTTGKTYTVFCTEHGTEFITGTVYNGQYYTPTNEQMKKAAQVAYYGWYKEQGEYVVDGGILDDNWAIPVRKKYVFTQQYLWEVLDQSHATCIDSGLQSEYENFKNNIENEINNMKKRPSFDGTEIEIKAGETKTITDSNNVLQNYNTINQTKEGIRFEHTSGENTMKITVPEDCKIERLSLSDATMKEWGMIKNGSEDHDTTMYFTFDTNIQNQLYSLNYNDPVTLSFDLKINLFGRLELSKLDDKGSLIDGATFNITGPDNFNRDVKVTGGKITIDSLKPGTYVIKEKIAPKGFLLDTKAYNVEVKTNQTTEKAIANTKPTGTFTIKKYNSDKSATIPNVKFHIWNDNGYDEEFSTNQNGEITVNNLELTKYYYQELESVSGYLIDDTIHSFTLSYKDQNTSVIYGNEDLINYEPFGEIRLTKTDAKTGNSNRIDGNSHHGDASIAGSVYTLYAKEDIYNVAKTIKYFSKDEPIATFTFDQYGVASIKIINTETKAPLTVKGDVLCGIPMGKFIAKESIVPEGYNLDDNIYEYTISYKDERTNTIQVGGTVVNNVKTAPFEVIKISTNTNEIAKKVPNAEFTAILTKYVDYYGSFDEALKHLDEFSEDEYSVFRTNSEGHRNIKSFGLWKIYNK